MENAFFYTFSTIAQALAGAIALLGAFVLFKLQHIDAELTEHAHNVIEAIPYDRAVQVLWDHYVQGHWDALLLGIPANYPFTYDLESLLNCCQRLTGFTRALTSPASVHMCGRARAETLHTIIAPPALPELSLVPSVRR